MENNPHVPNSVEAREALAHIDTAQRAVRDAPWPTWIYPVNALLLGAMTLTFALGDDGFVFLLATSAALIAVNMLAGYRMGAPFTLPTSRAFLASAGAAGACVLTAFIAADLTAQPWPIVVLAIAAAAFYLAGGVAHRRSTGAPR
ncbi:hypothetical protein [Couchioplanes caeruleus]|uniref:Uncharacterized protein n=2 Tax=Couchioplanes caeruleus TaxID=56438 RepID=A0A1K0GN73_9ACTN|nr:hypothetical protein [Couchioplanes caeruleus]OJF12524.1 hypothetical protein BG844_20140 [Couchioplanes caeruleus subsp. caeruleus]ROP27568.1 hypothetical protein EDD30_0248 [Couchioplanes caeruleus]